MVEFTVSTLIATCLGRVSLMNKQTEKSWDCDELKGEQKKVPANAGEPHT
jgi:hypothetical protein